VASKPSAEPSFKPGFDGIDGIMGVWFVTIDGAAGDGRYRLPAIIEDLEIRRPVSVFQFPKRSPDCGSRPDPSGGKGGLPGGAIT